MFTRGYLVFWMLTLRDAPMVDPSLTREIWLMESQVANGLLHLAQKTWKQHEAGEDPTQIRTL